MYLPFQWRSTKKTTTITHLQKVGTPRSPPAPALLLDLLLTDLKHQRGETPRARQPGYSPRGSAMAAVFAPRSSPGAAAALGAQGSNLCAPRQQVAPIAAPRYSGCVAWMSRNSFCIKIWHDFQLSFASCGVLRCWTEAWRLQPLLACETCTTYRHSLWSTV